MLMIAKKKNFLKKVMHDILLHEAEPIDISPAIYFIFYCILNLSVPALDL